MLHPTPTADTRSGDARQDLVLVQDVLRNDPRAVERFVERMRCVPRFLSALSRRLRVPLSADELADVTQDTLAQIWRKLGAYEGRAVLETWAYRFCALELSNWIRRRRREPDASSLAPGRWREAAADADDAPLVDVERVNTGLARLRVEEERVVRLKHYDELTFEEIAARIDAPASTAKALYYRGLDKLRSFLRPHVEGDER